MNIRGLVLVVSVVVATLPAPALDAAGAAPEQASTQVLAGGSYGDGLEATRASLLMPRAVLATDDGVYVSDFWHHQVRLVRPDGTIERVAGTDEGFAGDGGPAVRARLNRPMGLALDGRGGLLIADAGNSRIRRVDLRSGLIDTVVGNGKRTYAGDGGPATEASLAFPHDVAAADDGSIYVADTENARVRRVTRGGTITTFAGDGTGLVDFDDVPASAASVVPLSVATDGDGNVYVGDHVGCRVRKILRGSRTITTVAGGNPGCGFSGDGGPATAAALGPPEDIALDGAGNVYISDNANMRVRRVDAAGTIGTIAGSGERGCAAASGPATTASVALPFGVSADAAGNVFFGSDQCHRVYRVSPDGTIAPFAGNGTQFAGGSGDPATAINFVGVEAVTWGPNGQPYFADVRGIWTVDPAGRAQLVAGGANGDADGPAAEAAFRSVTGLAFDEAGALWIADVSAGKVKRLAGGVVTTMAGDPSAPASTVGKEGDARSVRLAVPSDVAPRPGGGVYISEASQQGGRVRLLDGGVLRTVAGGTKRNYMADPGDGGAARDAYMDAPWGLELAPDGALYVADRHQHRIRRIGTDGTITTVAGDGGEESRGDGTLATLASFSTPEDVAVDADGNMFITDGKNAETYVAGGYVVRHVSAGGMVTRLAGTGSSREGLDGPSLQSGLRNPLAVDAGPGGLLVGDSTTVRLVTPPGGAWPDPPRAVRCDPYFPDAEGDARPQVIVSFLYAPSQPWVDLVDGDVRTDAENLTVTFDLLDLNERVYAPPTAELGAAWSWLYRFKVGDDYKYLAAFAPYGDPTEVPAVTFEYGESSMGRGATSYDLTPTGTATGTFDLEGDRVTITAPLSGLGLEAGDQVIYHEASTGRLVEVPPFSRFMSDDDTTYVRGFLPGTMRSYTIGQRCPEDFR